MTVRVLLLTALALVQLGEVKAADGNCTRVYPSSWHFLNPNSTEGRSGLLLAESGDRLYTLLPGGRNPYERICNSTSYKESRAENYFPEEKLEQFPCMFWEDGGFYYCQGGSCLSYAYLECNDKSEADWRLYHAALIHQDYDGEVVEGREGLLMVAFSDVNSDDVKSGTVCDDNFNWHAAHLSCQYLGYDHAENWGSEPQNFRYINESLLEEHNVQILVDEVNCGNNTSKITECEAQVMAGHDCSRSENLWLKCGYRNGTDFDWDLLFKGLIRVDDFSGDARIGREGLLTLAFQDKYNEDNHKVGSVCDDYFNNHAADLTCQYLGYRGAEDWGSDPKNFQYFPRDAFEQQGGEIVIDDVKCDEKDRNITECEMNILESNDCGLDESLWLKCYSEWELASLELHRVDNRTGRVVNGTEGVLVVSYRDHLSNYDAGAVCDRFNDFNKRMANMACSFMGYGSAKAWGTKPYEYLPETWRDRVKVLVNELYCSKADSSIRECEAFLHSKGEDDCSMDDIVWLKCSSDDDDDDDEEEVENGLEVNFGGAKLTANLDKIRRKWFF